MAFIYAVYLDALIMENALLDTVSLLCTGIWCKKPVGCRKLIPGVAFGVLSGTVCFLYVKNFALYLWLIFGVVNPLMLIIAFGRMSPVILVRQYGCCGVVNLLMGGVMNWLRQLLPKVWYGWILPISCVMVFAIVILAEWGVKQRDAYVEVSLLVQGQVVRLRALRDTGNCLRDGLTGRPVCIVSEELIKELKLSEQMLRGIPYETVAGKDVLKVCPTTKFYIMQKGEMTEQRDIMIGFAKKSLFQGKKYQMILHKEFC